METPTYIKSLLMPNAKKPQGRKVWSIDLETVWLPFFIATNTMGDTAIPAESIGCPLRLGYEKTGAVRFTPSGRPVIKVAKEISDNVRLVRDNFTANLLNYAGSVIRENGEAYKAQIALAKQAGEPIYQHDRQELASALKARAEAEALAIAEAVAKSKAEAEAVAKAKAEADTKAEAKPKARQRDLVTA